MQSTSKMLVWEDLRSELRKLRGQNLFRGNENHLWHQDQIRIPYELRAGRENLGEIVVHIEETMEQCWAERLPQKQRIDISGFEQDWKKWLRAIIDECRGKDYLKTNSKSADYRKEIAASNEK